MPDDEIALRVELLAMDPFDFECHVMSFFEKAGLYAVADAALERLSADGWLCRRIRLRSGLMVMPAAEAATQLLDSPR